MQIENLLDRIPLHFLFILLVVLVFLSVTAGFAAGNYVRRRKKNDAGIQAGAIIGAMLGLFAFMLVFTFGMAASRFDARKEKLLDEVNAIGTAYLRTEFLGEPEGSEAREILRRYVDLRVELARDPRTLTQVLSDSDVFQRRLWSQVAALQGQAQESVLLGLYVQSLNDVFDLHTMRVVIGIQYRIPGSIWLALFFVAILTMWAVGYDLGLNNAGSRLFSLVLALTFSAVMLLVADLDRGTHGLIRVNQAPMLELQQRLNSSGP